MNVLKSESPAFEGRKTAVTVGTFDGVHRGHRAVLDFLTEEASRRGLSPVAVTFDPHPLWVVSPDRAPLLLETPEERAELLREAGVEVVTVDFTPEVMRITADEWIGMLADCLGAKLLVAGYDNTFGSDGMTMSLSDYRGIGLRHGVEVIRAPEVRGVSSTAIRRLLAGGDVGQAASQLGFPYTLSGVVEPGRKLGRRLGFPTANLAIAGIMQIPGPGVYAAEACVANGRCYPAVVNIGVRPTVDENLPLTVEAHLCGFEGNLYGRTLRLRFLRRLRDERRFSTLDELKAAIAGDVASVCATCGAGVKEE